MSEYRWDPEPYNQIVRDMRALEEHLERLVAQAQKERQKRAHASDKDDKENK
jgi:hypothetical protein